MVAFATEHAPQPAETERKNRARKNFLATPETRRVDRRPARHPRREKPDTFTKTASGVRYYGFRFYSPSQGRFLNRDPIEEAGGLNLYAFVRNDPVNHWDYLGLKLDSFPSNIPIRTHTPLEHLGEEYVGWDWPDEVAFRNGRRVRIKGSISIYMSFLHFVDPDVATDDAGNTLRAHAETHVGIHRKWWQQLKDTVDPIEGWYCVEKCAEIATDAANTIRDIHFWSQRHENGEFDDEVYGHRDSNPRIQMDHAQAQINSALSDLDRLEGEWNANNCVGPTGLFGFLFCCR